MSLGTIQANIPNEYKADLVVFSYNRPMQLYAFLESAKLYMSGLGETHVIYRADPAYDSAYDQVKKEFSDVKYVKQGDSPAQDFKLLTLKAAFESPHKYVIFAVDDIIIKDQIVIPVSISALEKENAYGFYLRLGSQIDHCYNINGPQKIPPLKDVGEGIYEWQLSQAEYDWGYPNTVDLTIYRKNDIKEALRQTDYSNPTTLEARWPKGAKDYKGLCFANTKMVNVAANRVQQIEPNRSMNGDLVKLLTLFNEGYKIDITPFHELSNASPHIEADFKFIKRVDKKAIKEERFGLPIEALSIAARYLPNNPVIIEAGAYEGVESVGMAKKWPEGLLYCFEPIPELYNKMIFATKDCKNIKTYPYAIGNTVGFAKMYVSEYPYQPGVPSQSSSLLEPKEHLKYSDVKFSNTISVPITTFDNWAKENKIDHVDLMWLDMQGFELNALKASPDILKTVKVILTEVEHVEAYANQALFSEIKTWLEEQGFVLAARNYYIDWMEDALFVRKELIDAR